MIRTPDVSVVENMVSIVIGQMESAQLALQSRTNVFPGGGRSKRRRKRERANKAEKARGKFFFPLHCTNKRKDSGEEPGE